MSREYVKHWEITWDPAAFKVEQEERRRWEKEGAQAR